MPHLFDGGLHILCSLLKVRRQLPVGARRYNAAVRRHLFTVASAVSLLLFAAASLLWIRGHYLTDLFWCRSPSPGRIACLESSRGLVVVGGRYATFGQSFAHLSYNVDRNNLDLLGAGTHAHDWGKFRYATVSVARGGGSFVRFPLWSACVFFAILPALWWRRSRQQLRRPGLCPTCLYDLRASTQRCPECGTPITPAARLRLAAFTGVGLDDTTALIRGSSSDWPDFSRRT